MMNKAKRMSKRTLYIVLILMGAAVTPVSAGAVAVGGAAEAAESAYGENLSADRQATYRIDHTISIFNDVMRQLDINYVDTLNYEALTEKAINAMLREIDPYTVYFPKDKDRELKMMTTGKYGGIGSLISQRSKDTTLINMVYADAPAQKAGVLPGDIILSVDGHKVKGLSVSEVSNLLRGVPGSIVTLELNRQGDKITKRFGREEIHLPAVDYDTVFADSIAYIAFSEFTTGSAEAFANTLDNLVYNHGAKALIIDLRGNGGGIVDEAIKIVNLFVESDVEVVRTRGKIASSNRVYKTVLSPRYKDLPLVILVDENSASASEIVAGSLQDLHRAYLIGHRTFGKGLVQNLRPIVYDGHLKVTTSKYYLPSGRCIQAIDYAERQKGKRLHKDTLGGIEPDLCISEDSSKLDITYTLYVGHMFFDYATEYYSLHPVCTIDTLIENTDAIIEDFIGYLERRGFTYETETSKYFADILHMAIQEDIDSATVAALRAIEPSLRPSYREAIYRNKDEVMQFVGAEIISRYTYQRGRAAYLLRSDRTLSKAKEYLQSQK